MKTKMSLFVLLLLIFSSCRNNNFSPSEPNSIVDVDINGSIFESPNKGDIYYIDDSIIIEYNSFSNSNFIDIYAEKKGKILFTIGTGIPNTGKYVWKTTKDIPTSNHYQIRIVDPSHTDIYALSERFGIISK